ncbi:MAG: DUF262 domain-containing protein, partial [candidate division Zixibacteria bacterium]|nr:DUF262 domain-containing protein [candidate division Zixibacteria bacterium]
MVLRCRMGGMNRKDFRITAFEIKTLSWWRTRRSKIDMNPPYQRRGRLWSEADKAYLIDSILNGYDIPKLYMADFTWGDSALNKRKLPYAIIDGKQRFEAIFDFFDGKIVLNDDFVYLENPQLKVGGLGYEDLKKNHPQVAEEFDNFNLHVMSVTAQSEEPINELFVRLNRSKSLTGAEIRNAMAGPAPGVIRQIADHDFFKTNITFVVKRGQDWNAAAKFLIFEFYEKPRETKKTNLDAFVKSMKIDPNGHLELAARKVVDVLNNMSEIFLPKDKLLGSAGVLPVYYWFVRNEDEAAYPRIRKFLVGFERARRENRRVIEHSPHSVSIDRKLMDYD